MRPSLSLLFLAASASCLCASRCSGFGPGREEASLSLLSYNVHNLFNAVDEGSEYPEFSLASGRWDEARYRSRLAAVGKAVGAALPEGRWPDILCLEEVENEAVLRDLAAGPLKAGAYRYLGMAPAPGSPVNCGILSSRPLAGLKAHCLASGIPGRAVEGRCLLEARVEAGGTSLILFVLHWKSKLGGAEASEALRREAAALLAERVGLALDADPGALVLACGDFNEGPDEYLRVGRRYPTALLPQPEAGPGPGGPRILVTFEAACAGRASGGEPVLYSPWAEGSGYSYSYQGGRERIDGFLLSAGLVDGRGLDFRGFSAVDAAFLLDAEGNPLAWSPSVPGGYSDHLPILLLLQGEGR
ncbi:MAG TPA: endonuclease/exonuclease/phosphatase family protein [Spirochaetales bacterium]|nr:endonuclease/exonuclease/phosphatase family protein [Spirochaetales bacterium]HRY56499.1 endonuclease/exonuclease/phosphatase family protein [Spirochaetia bacterium]